MAFLSSFVGAEPFELESGDVVSFLGGTNMVRVQKAGYLETLLSHAFADARPKFRDLSWEGDTVDHLSTEKERWRKDGYGHMKPEAFGDLREQLRSVGATVVIAQFGKMELLEGRSTDEFLGHYRKLIGLLTEEGRRAVIVSPTPFGSTEGALLPQLSGRNSRLRAYVEAIRDDCEGNGVGFINIFDPLLALVRDSSFMDEGIHISEKAQPRYAAIIGEELGIKCPNWAELGALKQAVVEKHRLWNEYWRPANWKCLFGDDSSRIFSIGTVNELPTLQEEWRRYPKLIAEAEETIWTVAGGAPMPKPVLTPVPRSGAEDADLTKELASFHVAEGYAVNLFASEALGIANPLCLHWDAHGRLYVACSDVYPQVVPGERPNDRIVVLEDTDGDGEADRSTTFAERLNIPTGIETGHGGVYVAQGTELLFLRDTNGDLVADERRVLMSGFGNGDSHQTANSLVWSPEGDLYFCQGDGIESRIETPHGVSSLFQAGVFRLRPQTMQLDGLLDDFMGPGNPWGVAFDDYGQSVVIDGAGGISYLTPASLPVKHRLKLPRIGKPGGYCGVEFHAGHFLIGDYKLNRVSRFTLREDGAGFEVEWNEPLIHSKHSNFRPIDVKQGPDGAVYVVDWYNPVICHQDDYYRHPDRDKIHGRIWRVAPDTTTRPPVIAGAGITELVELLGSSNRWIRHHAKMELTRHDRSDVGAALQKWRDASAPANEKSDFEAAAAAAFAESPQADLLSKISGAKEPRIRAFAARLVGRWHDQLQNPHAMLEQFVRDDHPLVRMEAVLACGRIPSARSIEIAAMAVDLPVDRWIDYALTQAAHYLKQQWIPAFEAGELTFDDDANRQAAILGKIGSTLDLEKMRLIAEDRELPMDVRRPVLRTLASTGRDEDMHAVLNPESYRYQETYDRKFHVELLKALGKSRDHIKGEAAKLLHQLVASNVVEIRAEALRLAALWDVDALEEKVEIAAMEASDKAIKVAAYEALGFYGNDSGSDILTAAAAADETARDLRQAAVIALSRMDIELAAKLALPLLPGWGDDQSLLVAFLSREQGEAALASALEQHPVAKPVAAGVLQALRMTGRPASELTRVLKETVGIRDRVPDFDPKFINDLVIEAQSQGDAARGKEVYARGSMACVTCHQIDGAGGTTGPDLSAAGTTIPPARLVEEVIWPRRQVKEGYSLLQVTLKDGSLAMGYERTTRNDNVLQLRDFATGVVREIGRDHIVGTLDAGSSMPPGLVAQLSRSELRDLIRYLLDLGKKGE